ncbi:MAG: CAP domain-containing protein [Anaerolineae bacterium]|nr:CAP domain-containing protein [Anaerolineae bacterium]
MKRYIRANLLLSTAVLLLSCNLPMPTANPTLPNSAITAKAVSTSIGSTATPMNITIPPPPPAEANLTTPTIVAPDDITSLTDIVSYDDTAEMLDLVNQARCREGLSPVVDNALLRNAATQHGLDMLTNSFFDHQGIDGDTVGDRVSAQGYAWLAVGENLAAGATSTTEAFELWWESPGHKANILNADFSEAGLSHLFRAGSQLGHYWTLVLANQGAMPPTCEELGF